MGAHHDEDTEDTSSYLMHETNSRSTDGSSLLWSSFSKSEITKFIRYLTFLIQKT